LVYRYVYIHVYVLISFIFFYPSNTQKNDININIPNDYSFKYLPHETQTNDQNMKVKELEKQIEHLEELKNVKMPNNQNLVNNPKTSIRDI